jgi:DNA repair protein RecO (recombination protein O)
MIVTSEAIVLRTMKYRESSLIATLLTHNHGKLSVLAKGGRDRKSRVAGSLQAMNHVSAVYYMKEGRDLHLLSQCDLVRPFHGLTRDLERMSSGLALVELTSAVIPAEEADLPLFNLVAESLAAINDATKNVENALYFFEMHLLEHLGFKPDLHHCFRCRTPIDEREASRGLHMSQHGILCAACSRAGFGLEELTAPAVKVLQRLQEVEYASGVTHFVLPPRLRGEIAGVLRRFLQGHIEGLRTLRSETVFSTLP